MWCIYNGILVSHPKNEILPFTAVQMPLENILLSEISRRKTNTVWYHLYVESKKYTNEYRFMQKEADSQI